MSSKVIGRYQERPHLFEEFFSRMMPFDHLLFIYCWVIIILTVNFARPIEDFSGVIFFHAAVIGLVLLISQFVEAKTGRVSAFIRYMYPLIIMTFLYQSVGPIIRIMTPEFLDYQIVGFEKSIFGVNPTVWLDGHLSAIVSDTLSAGYFSYYFLIPGMALVLFATKRDRELRRFVTATCVTFFVSYLTFILYPAEGPRYYFATTYLYDVPGTIFRPIVEMVIREGGLHGGAMPSSHVAEAMMVLFFAIRNFRKKAYFLIPVIVALALGTVYGRYHYVSDVAVGAVIAVIAYFATLRFYPTPKNFSRQWQLSDYDKKRKYVSNSH